MPSKTVSLGRYVVLKRRADGTGRVYLQVPARLRPSGWPATVPLCRDLRLPGDVADLTPGEVAEIVLASDKANAEFDRAKFGADAPPPRNSLQTAISAWQRSTAWHELTDKTREGYGYSIKKIQAWSLEYGHPDPTTISRSDIEEFLSVFNDRPTTKRQTLKALRLVMDQVVALGWRTDNPCTKLKVKVPRTKAAIWEQADVDLYVSVARKQGMESLALIILLEWEIGQRLTDVRAFRPGAEYDAAAGVFRFAQSKTDEPVVIEISATLREMLNAAGEGQLFLFRNERTGKAYTENRLSKSFGWLRHAVVKAQGRALVLRQLRHSCVVQLARAGCTVPEIASITGHALGSVHSILSTYLPRDGQVARNAQVKRGIVMAREVVA